MSQAGFLKAYGVLILFMAITLPDNQPGNVLATCLTGIYSIVLGVAVSNDERKRR